MKVLIIQQKMIGDVLATSVLFEAIKQKYPKAKLHYVLNSHTYPVVEHNPFIDKFHFFYPGTRRKYIKALVIY
jgi:heptosyltransferase-2